ncbi:MAG: DNA polymerase III subunit delta [Candidatus Saganbacteria bacterium]|nr:DNA polymerase III subunit delta [Candidatus Saganbacteria bacterium]
MAKRIYLFYGEEEFLLKERIFELRTSFGDAGLNLEKIDAADLDQEKIIGALQTQGLLFGPRLVLIHDADLRGKEWESVIPALEQLADGITVVFQARALDKRSKIFKTLSRLGETCEFRPFADWEQDQVVAWIQRRSKASGKKMGREAAVVLQETCGSNLMKLASEISKLAAYSGSRGEINGRDVEELASPGETSVFALADALAAKNAGAALSAFRGLERNKVELVPLIAMLTNRYRIMLLGKSLRDPFRIAQEVGTSPSYVKRCLRSLDRFQLPELKRCLALLLDTDIKIKTGQQGGAAFELLLASLCGN